MTVTPILSIKNLILNHKFNNQTIAHIDEFIVKQGDIVFINGKNGSGKSTLLNFLFTSSNKPNYIQSNEGQYKIDYAHFMINKSYSIENLMNQHVVYLSQKNIPPYKMSIEKTLVYPTLISVENINLSKQEKKSKLDEARKLARFFLMEGIHDGTSLFMDMIEDSKFYQQKRDQDKENYTLDIFKRKYSSDLSGGQTKLVAFLSALIKVKVLKSNLFILDEPLNNLDFNKIQKVCTLIEDLALERKEENFALIIVSHLMIFPLIHNEKAVQYEIDQTSKKLILSLEKIDHTSILNDWS